MIKATASGCAVVWGGFYPSNPYTVEKNSGRGVPYGHSLFEDNAEYGYGIMKGYLTRRSTLISNVEENILPTLPEKSELATELKNWIFNRNNVDRCEVAFERITALLADIPESDFENSKHLRNLRT